MKFLFIYFFRNRRNIVRGRVFLIKNRVKRKLSLIDAASSLVVLLQLELVEAVLRVAGGVEVRLNFDPFLQEASLRDDANERSIGSLRANKTSGFANEAFGSNEPRERSFTIKVGRLAVDRIKIVSMLPTTNSMARLANCVATASRTSKGRRANRQRPLRH